MQPRIRLCRSFDERSHTYLGYALRVRGSIGGEAREFLVGVGEGAHAKHRFRAGDTVAGVALPVADPRLETVEFYKVSDLRVSADEIAEEPSHLRGAAFHRFFRSIVSAVIGALQRERTKKNARAACGAASWQSKCLSISGIRSGVATEPRHSAMALFLVLSTNPDRLARFLAVAA